MDSADKIVRIDHKITILKAQQKTLLETCRNEQFAIVREALQLMDPGVLLEQEIFAGALLFVQEKVLSSDLLVEGWRQAGRNFLQKHRRSKNKHTPPSHQHSAGDQLSSATPQS